MAEAPAWEICSVRSINSNRMIFRYLMRESSKWDVMQSQEQRAEWLARRTSGSTERVLMTLSDGESVSVLPLWIAVWQTLKGGLARCGLSAEHGSITDAYCSACRGIHTHERLSITEHLLKDISEAKSKGRMRILYL